LKQVLGAAKKPVENITLDKLGEISKACLQTTGILAATMERRHLKFSASAEEIGVLISALLKEGVIA
jgi:electron transfer flavoprotein beta subunit